MSVPLTAAHLLTGLTVTLAVAYLHVFLRFPSGCVLNPMPVVSQVMLRNSERVLLAPHRGLKRFQSVVRRIIGSTCFLFVPRVVLVSPIRRAVFHGRVP